MTMRYIKFLSVLVCILLMINNQVYAASGKQIGTSGAMELLIPVGARSTALGGANIASIQGIDAMYWNPAGACIIDSRAEAMVSYHTYFADIGVTYISALANMGAVGNVGLSIKTLNFGDIMETTVENPDGTGAVFSPNYLTLSAHYSRKFTDRIHFGMNAKIISEKIMSTTASGFGVDLGLQYINENGLKLAFVLANFGKDMKFSGSDLEIRDQLPGTEDGSYPTSTAIPAAAFGLPTQVKIGIGYDLKVDDLNMVSLSGVFVNNATTFNTYTVGAEYALKKMVYLRGSYSVAFQQGLEGMDDKFIASNENYLYGPSFGGGIVLNLGSGMNFKFDYAYQLTEFFDDLQLFSFVFSL